MEMDVKKTITLVLNDQEARALTESIEASIEEERYLHEDTFRIATEIHKLLVKETRS